MFNCDYRWSTLLNVVNSSVALISVLTVSQCLEHYHNIEQIRVSGMEWNTRIRNTTMIQLEFKFLTCIHANGNLRQHKPTKLHCTPSH